MTGPASQPAGGVAYIDPTASVHPGARVAAGAWIGPNVTVAAGCTVGPGAVLGFVGSRGVEGALTLGPNVWIGPAVVVEPHCTLGPDCRIEAHSVVRAATVLGAGVFVGARCTLMGHCRVDDGAHLEAEVHVGEFSVLREHCQLMPGVVLLNDPYPPTALDVAGPVIGRCAVVGVNALIYPRVTLGFHAMVGAMSLVKKDVPDYALVHGNPAAFLCDVRRIRTKVGDRWVYPYPWMRHNMPGEDITKPAL